MINSLFVNLPVESAKRSAEFFKALGFEFVKDFSNEETTCIKMSESIYAMLLEPQFFSTFCHQPIADAKKTIQVLLALMVNEKQEVDSLMEKALAQGAVEPRPVQDLGFMYGRAFQDLDGHVWEIGWMDPSAIPSQS